MIQKIRSFLLICLVFLSLFGCRNSHYESYQCNYGKEVPLTLKLPYDMIDGKAIQNNLKDNGSFETYFFNVYLIENQKESDSFFHMKNLSYSDTDVEMMDFSKEPSRKLVFLYQIPEGYRVRRKPNIQETEDGREIFVTPDFYFYRSRTEISYMMVGLEKDPMSKRKSTYSCLFEIRDIYLDNLNSSEIRFVYVNA